MFNGCVCLVTQSYPTLWGPWTVACQAPLSMEFSRQIPGDLPDPGIELESLASPLLAVHGVVKSWTRLSDQHFHFSNVQSCLLNE